MAIETIGRPTGTSVTEKAIQKSYKKIQAKLDKNKSVSDSKIIDFAGKLNTYIKENPDLHGLNSKNSKQVEKYQKLIEDARLEYAQDTADHEVLTALTSALSVTGASTTPSVKDLLTITKAIEKDKDSVVLPDSVSIDLIKDLNNTNSTALDADKVTNLKTALNGILRENNEEIITDIKFDANKTKIELVFGDSAISDNLKDNAKAFNKRRSSLTDLDKIDRSQQATGFANVKSASEVLKNHIDTVNSINTVIKKAVGSGAMTKKQGDKIKQELTKSIGNLANLTNTTQQHEAIVKLETMGIKPLSYKENSPLKFSGKVSELKTALTKFGIASDKYTVDKAKSTITFTESALFEGKAQSNNNIPKDLQDKIDALEDKVSNLEKGAQHSKDQKAALDKLGDAITDFDAQNYSVDKALKYTGKKDDVIAQLDKYGIDKGAYEINDETITFKKKDLFKAKSGDGKSEDATLSTWAKVGIGTGIVAGFGALIGLVGAARKGDVAQTNQSIAQLQQATGQGFQVLLQQITALNQALEAQQISPDDYTEILNVLLNNVDQLIDITASQVAGNTRGGGGSMPGSARGYNSGRVSNFASAKQNAINFNAASTSDIGTDDSGQTPNGMQVDSKANSLADATARAKAQGAKIQALQQQADISNIRNDSNNNAVPSQARQGGYNVVAQNNDGYGTRQSGGVPQGYSGHAYSGYKGDGIEPPANGGMSVSGQFSGTYPAPAGSSTSANGGARTQANGGGKHVNKHTLTATGNAVINNDSSDDE